MKFDTFFSHFLGYIGWTIVATLIPSFLFMMMFGSVIGLSLSSFWGMIVHLYLSTRMSVNIAKEEIRNEK